MDEHEDEIEDEEVWDLPECDVYKTLQYFDATGFRLSYDHRVKVLDFLRPFDGMPDRFVVGLGFRLENPILLPSYFPHVWEEKYLSGRVCLCPVGQILDGESSARKLVCVF